MEIINKYLSENNLSIRYGYTSNYSSLNTFQEIILDNILNNHPVVICVSIPENDNTYFPYETDGHYIVVKGAQYDPDLKCYVLTINDPHNLYSDTYYVPIDVIYSYINPSNRFIIGCDSIT